MINLEEAVIRKLKTAQHTLCTVESCTGGLISQLLTNVPGASEVFWGAFVTYDNSLKADIGVPPELLARHGAVSPEVATSMAENGLKRMQSVISRFPSDSLLKGKGQVCISTTGIAGPSIPNENSAVGLCYIGLAISNKKTTVEVIRVPDSLGRVQIKNLFAQKALEILRGIL